MKWCVKAQCGLEPYYFHVLMRMRVCERDEGLGDVRKLEMGRGVFRLAFCSYVDSFFLTQDKKTTASCGTLFLLPTGICIVGKHGIGEGALWGAAPALMRPALLVSAVKGISIIIPTMSLTKRRSEKQS